MRPSIELRAPAYPFSHSLTPISICPIHPATKLVNKVEAELIPDTAHDNYSIGTMMALRDIARASLDVVAFDELVHRGNQSHTLLLHQCLILRFLSRNADPGRRTSGRPKMSSESAQSSGAIGKSVFALSECKSTPVSDLRLDSGSEPQATSQDTPRRGID